LRHQARIARERRNRESERRGEEVPRQQAAERVDRIGMSDVDRRDPGEDDGEDRGVDEGHEDRPPEPHHRLFVSKEKIPCSHAHQECPVLPLLGNQLGQHSHRYADSLSKWASRRENAARGAITARNWARLYTRWRKPPARRAW